MRRGGPAEHWVRLGGRFAFRVKGEIEVSGTDVACPRQRPDPAATIPAVPIARINRRVTILLIDFIGFSPVAP